MLVPELLSLLISTSTRRPISSSIKFKPSDSQVTLSMLFSSASAAESANVYWVLEYVSTVAPCGGLSLDAVAGSVGVKVTIL